MDDIMNTDRTRRDRWGRYLVVPPDGGKPVGYTRATTIAKTLDDTTALMSWGERMTAIGLARRPDLLAQIDDNTDDTKTLNALCQKAKEAGGATIRRDLGTALHSILERSWIEPGYTPPVAHINDVKAVHATLNAHGLTVVDGMNERIVVLDEYRIAGTFDLMLADAHGNLYLADIKTGSTVKYGGLSFATQLSIYANADSLYTQGTEPDGSGDVRESMPNVSQAVAYLIHVEPGSGRCDMHQLNLDYRLVETAMMVRDMRKATTYLSPVKPTADPRDRWIRDRIATLKQIAPDQLIRMWPTDIPTPKNSAAYDNDTIDRLDALCARVEADNEVPFPTGDPTIQTPPRATQTPYTAPHANQPDEGDLQPDQLDELRTQFATLNDDQREWIGARVTEARHVNMPIRVAETPTERRIHIANALIHGITHYTPDDLDGMIRDTIRFIVDDDAVMTPTVTLGSIIGLLNSRQAGTFRSFIELGARNPDRTPNGV